MTRSELAKVAARYGVSKDVARLSVHETVSDSPVVAPKRKRRSPTALDQNAPPKPRGQVRVVVRLIAVGGRPRDDDNATGGYKGLRDIIAASLGIDDGNPRIQFKVHHCRD